VLSAGPTPHTPLAEWSFTIHGAVAEPVSRSWGEFPALPSGTITTDIRCVTKWSKLDTSWRGVSLDTLLEAVDASAGYHRVLRRRLQQPGASGRHRRARVGGLRVRRRAACPRARRSGPTARPAPVLLEERRVGPPADADRRRSARLLGGVRLPQARRPMARAALPRRLSWHTAILVEAIEETHRAKTLIFDPPGWASHRAGEHRRAAHRRERRPGPPQLLSRLRARG
jgi:DMSO/TMAO reductase YedYZ molybdopterin-dependent catalytic subunit